MKVDGKGDLPLHGRSGGDGNAEALKALEHGDTTHFGKWNFRPDGSLDDSTHKVKPPQGDSNETK